MANKTYKQGVYTLRHPEKYIGDPTKVCFRSSWELEMHKFLDCNPNILRWSSEEVAIPYVKPTTGRVHRYFPDYWVEYKNKAGEVIQEIIEVKPMNQVDLSKKKRLTEYEKITYAVNMAKWQAAKQFCDKHEIKFTILTENHMFGR
jgi:hypothetical protein